MALHCAKCGHRFLSGAGGVCYNCERAHQEALRYGRRRAAVLEAGNLTAATSPSPEHTLRLHRQGMSPEAIAEARGLTPKTVYDHLGGLVEIGRLLHTEVLSPLLAQEIKTAYEGLSYPETAEQVAALLPRPVPVGLVAYALKACGLKLGGNRRLIAADLPQATRVLQMAMSQSALAPYELVRLLQGRKLPTAIEKQLFGLFWGYDRDQLLVLVTSLAHRHARSLEVAS